MPPRDGLDSASGISAPIICASSLEARKYYCNVGPLVSSGDGVRSGPPSLGGKSGRFLPPLQTDEYEYFLDNEVVPIRQRNFLATGLVLRLRLEAGGSPLSGLANRLYLYLFGIKLT
jgi:hypothetical protein